MDLSKLRLNYLESGHFIGHFLLHAMCRGFRWSTLSVHFPKLEQLPKKSKTGFYGVIIWCYFHRGWGKNVVGKEHYLYRVVSISTKNGGTYYSKILCATMSSTCSRSYAVL